MAIVEQIDKVSGRPHRSRNIQNAVDYLAGNVVGSRNIEEAIKRYKPSGGLKMAEFKITYDYKFGQPFFSFACRGYDLSGYPEEKHLIRVGYGSQYNTITLYTPCINKDEHPSSIYPIASPISWVVAFDSNADNPLFDDILVKSGKATIKHLLVGDGESKQFMIFPNLIGWEDVENPIEITLGLPD